MPRMIDLIRASAVPATLMQAAAKGALALPAQETLEILVHLADHNKVFGQQARMTLAGWDENASRTAAADPQTPKEVLDYWTSSENLRPALLPILIENPSVNEERLAELASSGSREIAEVMMSSTRVAGSRKLREALVANAAVSAEEGEVITQQPPATLDTEAELEPVQESSVPSSVEPTGDAAPQAEESHDDVLAFLAQHAGEIAAEGEKPFQAIGGFYEDFVPSAQDAPEPPPQPVAESAPQAVSAAAAAAQRAAAGHKKTFLSASEERGSALQKIAKLDVKGRIQLAMKGTKEERSILIRDGTKIVALAVLESAKITDAEVEAIANQKNVLEAVLREISMKRRFIKNYTILRNLTFNPRTPLDVSLGLVKHLLISDLRNLTTNKDISDTLRKMANRMFRQKLASK